LPTRKPAPPGSASSAPPIEVATVARYGVFDVRRHERTDGESVHPYHTFACPDWVSVVAIRRDGRFVLVRQYRYGIADFTLEVPGGVIDDGERPAAAAARELREETGHESTEELVPLGFTYPNPVLQNNRHYMFLALDADPIGEPAFDKGEHCEVVVIDRVDLARMVEAGEIGHALVVVALERARQWLDAHRPAGRSGVQAGRLAELDWALERLGQLEELQARKVVDLARRLNPRLTAEDIRNPHDFPELADPDWHFEDGQLTALQSVATALRARRAELVREGTGTPTEASDGTPSRTA
jgi:8-oxo-dGTP pyrophosphatase MutT (NUDIX family)